MSPVHRSSGFSLVEVALAIGVASLSLLAIFGLLVTGSQTHHAALEDAASADILSVLAADLRATPKGKASSTQYNVAIPPSGASATVTLYFDSLGQSATSIQPSSRYRVTINFVPNDNGGRTATWANFRLTWPAGADPHSRLTGASEMFVALDRN